MLLSQIVYRPWRRSNIIIVSSPLQSLGSCCYWSRIVSRASIQSASSSTSASTATATTSGVVVDDSVHHAAAEPPQQQQQQQQPHPVQQRYPHMFAPLDLGPNIGLLPNRCLMGSMHSGLEGHSMPAWLAAVAFGEKRHDREGEAGGLSRMATYFQERARGGVGLMVTGGIAPNMQGWTGPFSSQLTSEDEMRQHIIVTDTVHSVRVPVGYSSTETIPARICLQILHTGRYAYHPFAVSASKTRSPISPFSARAMSVSDISKTTHDFVQTAVLAQRAGYDGVEIMGSEGYLLSQFLAPRTNFRTDRYGGSLENRARFPLDIVRQTRAAVGPSFLIIFRLSLLDLVDHGLLFDESAELAIQLQEAGCTIINTGIGWHEARVPTIGTCVPRGSFGFPTAELKERLGHDLRVPLVATNRFNHPTTIESFLAQGGSDLISMARPFLADPALIQKSRTDHEDEINTCIACNQACLDHVFIGRVASCLVNPRACHETELVDPDHEPPLPVHHRLNLGVVGSGPAGCAFAMTAAKRGHSVTLYDKDDAIGGQFNLAKRIPGKEEFHETLRYFRTMLRKHGVVVKLNATISLEDMKQSNHDKWIIATGVDPRNPKIPGQDHSNVLSYVDVLKRQKPVGSRVAVIGAGGIGFDVSEYLLHFTGHDHTADDVDREAFWKEWGIDRTLKSRGGLVAPQQQGIPKLQRTLYLLQRKEGKLGASLGKTTGWIHRATLNQSGAVEMLDGVQYDRIDENGHLHIKTKDGGSRILQVDNIVICAGQVEQRDLTESARAASDVDLESRVYTIGGAYQAGELDAKRAIDMGMRLALKIHDPDVIPGKHVDVAPPGLEEKVYQMLRRFA